VYGICGTSFVCSVNVVSYSVCIVCGVCMIYVGVWVEGEVPGGVHVRICGRV